MSPAFLYDVCVAGAGPAGATAAWYLARQGKRVLLLEKHRFPRDKVCGDALCTRAQVHLERMGVLEAIVAAGEAAPVAIGGFVSPRGLSVLGNSERAAGPLVLTVKRLVLDARLARAAAAAGAELVEESPVESAELVDGAWTIRCDPGPARPYRARVLIAADGASSRLARSLGVVATAPDAVCSRAFVEAGTSDFASDGMAFFPPALLPGYCSLSREAGGELNFCCYIIPGGRARPADLRRMHDSVLEGDPYVRAALGPRAKLGAMQAAPLRLAPVPRSYADQFLVVGDAAGQIDALTGGIQYGMAAAEIAAEVLDHAFASGDLRAGVLRRYHDRWMRSFGRDFKWSLAMARALARHPIFLDAYAEVLRRRGPRSFAEWAEAMTGARSKRSFLHPRHVLPVLAEAFRQWWVRPTVETTTRAGDTPAVSRRA